MTTIPGFTRHRIATNDIHLSVQEAGLGPPLILLHGYPQNGLCWSRVAPEFARHFRVLIPDLRGYGHSDAPPDDAGHTAYSKREMARDIIGLLDARGIGTSMVLGHDRGARVTYRLALDHPARVSRIGIIEIAPTADYWAAWNAEMAMAAYHWTFLAQPAPLPERMINADPVAYLDWTLQGWTLAKSLDAFPPEALAAYRAQARDPARIAAMCADYRAGATTDRRHDQADLAAGHRIAAPLRFLWGRHGFPARTGDPAGIWRKWASDVTDAACESGHFVMEENPAAVLDTFVPFFQG
ncbi:alpha/beta hydrolase [Fertoebacter nigrum]|uniref:Alpha/beta hydrolase n=1 Tax=Fertoeibacter niger TaxID=2656921 RepID=A0A8X8KSF4_9RHOB|nr:alpha/beta hydrolase [Fertoeibacter niger]NUB46417.1 alpha/beta hydrolase [Fertoeibacter niger]